MGLLSAIPVVGNIIDKIFGIIDKSVIDKDEANRLKNEITLRVAEMEHTEIVELTKARSEIIRAEAQGQSWLQRNWRPILMLSIIAIIINNYILFPYLRLIGIQAVILELPGDLYTLMTLGVGGYVVGRSGEKMIREYKK